MAEDVTIGDRTVVGVGSVVTHNVTQMTTFAGVPAKWKSANPNNTWHFYHYENHPLYNNEFIANNYNVR